MNQTRRAFVSTVGALAVGTGVSSGSSTTHVQEIGVYLDARLQGLGGRANEAVRTAHTPYEGAIDNWELSMGPAGVVEVPNHARSDYKSAHSWWKTADERPSDQKSVLLVDGRGRDWRHDGYADIGGDYAVATNALRRPVRYDGLLVAHEVTHLLGCHHRHGERVRPDRVTIASDLDDTTDRWLPRLSDRAVRQIRRSI